MPDRARSVLAAAVEAARPVLDAKRHTVSINLPKWLVKINAAPLPRLTQVISNLLINPAKHTDPGGRIQLKAIRENGKVAVSIKDRQRREHIEGRST